MTRYVCFISFELREVGLQLNSAVREEIIIRVYAID